jgi:hypothetical protein
MRLACLSLCALAATLALPLPAQPAAGHDSLRAVPADGTPFSISFAGRTTPFPPEVLAGLARREVTAFNPHEKKTHTYSGYSLTDLLAQAGVKFGEPLRGAALRQAVILHCRDHYDILFALAEFDPDFNPRVILLADRQDGQPWNQAEGPYRVVVPGDKRVARWARMVSSAEVVAVGN